MYTLEFTHDAISDMKRLKKSEPQALKKLTKLLDEITNHPEIGTGHPKPLGSNRTGQWSRKITDKHRLIYSIDNDKIIVLVISTFGHYDDK
ncbi:Txe/YoeB family addiction module toxin [Empedobacter sp. 225-1]|uniref:Txe/YoeB family addiction module toxin n=1 Tax=Empedobacter sp. 225-1 TaxID=2746725 RepID=UPI0025765B48|nr:Txe/YoeB family addiction module toxin [Empedobacter sp. 225-1]MDM1523846.1 Txe/YoeB family addiction module toxin [Empedobacter sp. 225-1]